MVRQALGGVAITPNLLDWERLPFWLLGDVIIHTGEVIATASVYSTVVASLTVGNSLPIVLVDEAAMVFCCQPPGSLPSCRSLTYEKSKGTKRLWRRMKGCVSVGILSSCLVQRVTCRSFSAMDVLCQLFYPAVSYS